MALSALAKGKIWVMSAVGSTFPERSRAMALAKGPHREPTTVISFTTIGHVSTGPASWNVDFKTSVPRGSVSRFHDQPVIFDNALRFACIPPQAFRLHSDAPCQREFVVVFAIHHHVTQLCAQNACNQLSEFSVSEDGRVREFLDIDLIENFASGGKRLDKNSLLVADRIGHGMQILYR